MPDTFESLDLSAELRAVLGELGYDTLTPIQAQALPVLLSGRDLIGQSETGSGKTAAFALPILQRLSLEPRVLQALVLCPTRELGAQVAREVRRLGRRLPGLRVLELAGGQPFGPQARALQRRVHVAVGTPGRVLDHLRRRTLGLEQIRTLVLDEADRMLDMGFEEDMEIILRATPARRQTVLFSATFPPAFEAISAAHQRDAVRLTVASEEAAPAGLEQRVVWVSAGSKWPALRGILSEGAQESALVFCNQKATVREVTAALQGEGVIADCLHGDLEQPERDRVMAMLRNRSLRVVVATDVAARGIDVAALELVVNFDLPSKAETYLHRVGRAGRAGREGRAVSLVSRAQGSRWAAVEALAGVPIEALEWSAEADMGALLRPAPMVTVRLSGGKRDKLRPADILGALTGEAGGLGGDEVGKIEIHPHHTYVAIVAARGVEAVRSLNEGRIKGRRFRARRVHLAGS